jgi:uncharacterized lipoprotein YddW (UPF0748 family)
MNNKQAVLAVFGEKICQNVVCRVSSGNSMNRRNLIPATILSLLPALIFAASTSYEPKAIIPPPPAREFRAAWITEVAVNPDWPSKPGLPVAQQKAELISLLDHAQQLHLNAVFFQVRPACDAFYSSPIEPWSDHITGVMGKAPEPFYDPLAFAIAEAHKRGLELHAWFNPFRAAHPSTRSLPAPNHITRTHPELVRHYADQVWLDPSEPEAQARTLAVVLDVVKRYDVDGIVFDDYFYPYPVKNRDGRELDFPDDASWQKYGLKTGLTRDDWRRKNVNQLIQNVSLEIKAAKPWVQFGISPFGIWRPQNPPQIKGLDAYGKIYADARLWLANGWVDFLAPQLYWPIAQREQSFPVLFNWWRSQNQKGRHVFAALNDAAVGEKFPADEITRQIQIVRTQTSVSGEIHYHLRSVAENPALAAVVQSQYAQPALVQTSPWINSMPPEKPNLYAATENSVTAIRWFSPAGEPPRWWLLQVCTNDNWTTEIFPASQTSRILYNSNPDAISLRAVDRLGNLSEPVVLSPRKSLPPDATRSATRMK